MSANTIPLICNLDFIYLSDSKFTKIKTFIFQCFMIFNRKLKIASAGLLFVIFSSCGPCRNLDCISSNYLFTFQIIDENTGENLVFGPNAILDYREIRLYSIIGSDTVNYTTSLNVGFGSTNHDSIIVVEVFPPTGVLFLEYPDKSRDTLSLTFSQRETECCGWVESITSITRNGTEFYQDLYEPLLFPR